MYKKPPFIHKNQFMKTIDHATEFERLHELNKDLPDFEDDPSASGDADKHGQYSKRSLADGHLLAGVDMGNYRGNGE